jgi:hypothetical protein
VPLNPRLKTVWRSPLLVIGAVMFLIGSGPLLVFCVMDFFGSSFTRSNPNPVFLGILATFTFLPSIALMLIGFGRWLEGKKL